MTVQPRVTLPSDEPALDLPDLVLVDSRAGGAIRVFRLARPIPR
jgi:hypothetical protein